MAKHQRGHKRGHKREHRGVMSSCKETGILGVWSSRDGSDFHKIPTRRTTMMEEWHEIDRAFPIITTYRVYFPFPALKHSRLVSAAKVMHNCFLTAAPHA